jgi:hypothetical protein
MQITVTTVHDHRTREAGDPVIVAAGLLAAGGVAPMPTAQSATVLGPALPPVPQASLTGPSLVREREKTKRWEG